MTADEFSDVVEALVERLNNSRGVCNEHSGMTAWIKLGCGLLSVLLIVFSYSTFVVAPDVRAQLEKQTAQNEKRFYSMERDIQETKEGLTRLANQRNLDHANKEKYIPQ